MIFFREVSVYLVFYLILSPDNSIDDPLQFYLYPPMVLLLVSFLLMTDQNFMKINLVCVPWVNAREKIDIIP